MVSGHAQNKKRGTAIYVLIAGWEVENEKTSITRENIITNIQYFTWCNFRDTLFNLS